ncbi:MAG TPA: Crp/Fnr family transcriptional regulator [Epsilonproteobacteria bacterium]|nr:Crp/Fnr family transcriptional regulator [Campylobacterota bacterium]
MKTAAIIQILKEISLFKLLDENRLHELASICKIKEYMIESEIFLEGNISDSLLIVVEGIVKICKHNDKGDKINMGFFKPHSLLAEAAIIRQTPFPSSAYCHTNVKILHIEIQAFFDGFIKDSNVSYMIIQSLLEKIQILQTNIHINISTTAKDKILAFYRKNKELKLEMKNYEVASLLGMNAATFSRNMSKLGKEGKIKKTHFNYEVIE